MGPAEEFRGEDGALGFAAAPPGGIFIKIGVGLLRKPDASPYDFARPYQILSGGKRIIRPESDRVDFIQELSDGDGYSYVYSKTVRTVGNKPELLLEHALKNTGRKVIDTSVYNHGFYVIDGQPSGPEFRVVFPFPLQSRDDLKGIVQLHGPELTFTRQLQPHESVFATLTGFSDEVRDDDVRVENTKTGAGVRQTVDRPLSKLNFWSVRDTICPEPYIHMTIKPGEEFRWKIRYEFYTLGANKR
jgi:hypothetical protein